LPFDQVLNLYVKPKTVLGHFEIVSNLASRLIEDIIQACATRSPSTLIVYDRAVETPCPTGYLEAGSRCPLKATTKANLTALRDKLLPSSAWSDRTGTCCSIVRTAAPERIPAPRAKV
jgi:hypothetical protein